MKLTAPALLLLATAASAQLRVVSYNTLDKPTGSSNTQLATIMSAIAAESRNGIAKRPDLLILQEQSVTSPGFIASVLNSTFGVNTYVAVTPGTQNNFDRQAFVYDSSTLSINGATTVASGGTRPAIYAQFTPTGYTSSAMVHAYGMHLNAGNASTRATELLNIKAHADQRGANANILYAGDFNWDSSSEQAYLNITAPGVGRAQDPINQPGNWNNNASFASIHTQSTRTTQLDDGGATGGMDDRFDMQMINARVLDGEGLSYIGPTAPGTASTHSYRAFGNGGTTFNRRINDPLNTSKPASVLTALHDFTDHLPVVADYQLPAKLSATVSEAAPRVIAGSLASVSVSVGNAAAVSVAAGADELDYTVTTTGGATGNFAGSRGALSANAVHAVSFNTASPGLRSAGIVVATSSPDVPTSQLAFTRSTTVLAPASPSLTAGEVEQAALVDFGIHAQGSLVAPVPLTIFNRETAAGFSASLDLTQVTQTSGTGVFDSTLAPTAGIAPGTSRTYSITADTSLLGLFAGQWLVQTRDEPIPGSQARATLTLDASMRVALAGDVTLDDRVNFDDLLVLAQNYDTPSGATWMTGDFDRDGAVGFSDLLALAQNYGGASIEHDLARAKAQVPEPAAMLALLVPVLALRRCRASGDHALDQS
jgi:endonuclease/exonuclease/phosphatase family metal-dependent hydrolase